MINILLKSFNFQYKILTRSAKTYCHFYIIELFKYCKSVHLFTHSCGMNMFSYLEAFIRNQC